MTNPITFTEDVLDSRDIIERFEELDEEHDRLVELKDMTDDERTLEEDNELEQLEAYFEMDEYTKLKAFVEEARDDCPDFEYGEQFINDLYFVEYAQQLAEDTGAINRDAQWPNYHIDWEAAADELKMDYTSYDVGCETYWARS